MTDPWAPYVARYRAGEWRDRIFRDMVLADAAAAGGRPTVLDIGCGRGLDGSVPLQQSVAEASGRFVGVEPDPEIPLGGHFTEAHRCLFEDAPLAPRSVDLAYSVMVLEHLPAPERFWAKLYDVLRGGGVFWALTVDARHPFCRASLLAERLKVKGPYLRLLGGRRGVDRYENYETFYRSNTPEDVRRLAGRFSSAAFVNFARVGQWSAYFPGLLRPIVDLLDRRAIARGRPGTLLAVRVQK